MGANFTKIIYFCLSFQSVSLSPLTPFPTTPLCYFSQSYFHDCVTVYPVFFLYSPFFKVMNLTCFNCSILDTIFPNIFKLITNETFPMVVEKPFLL